MRLEINKIYGTSSNHQLNFDVSGNYIAYIASGGVIVANIDPLSKTLANQRFFCANSSSVMHNGGVSSANAYLNLYMNGQGDDEIEKDEFGYPKLHQPVVINSSSPSLASSFNDLTISPSKASSPGLSSQSSNTFIQNKIQQISSITVSPDEKLLAVGESGTNPRILIFSLASDSWKYPIISISEHSFGIQCLRFSKDSKHLISFGDDHDGFVYVWRIQGSSTKIVALNKNSTKINGCLWDYENNLIFTYGLRTIKIWKFEETQNSDTVNSHRREKIQVKNVILGDHLNANFVSVVKFRENYITLTSKGDLLELNLDSGSLVSFNNKLSNASMMTISKDTIFYNDKNIIQSLKADELDTPTLQRSQTPIPSSTLETPSIISIHRYNTSLLAYLTTNEEIKIYDTRTSKSKNLIDRANIQGIKKTIHGLYTWNRNNEVRKFEDGSLVQTVDFHHHHKLSDNSIASLDISFFQELIIGDTSGTLTIYDKDGKLKESLKIHEYSINDLAYFQLNCEEYIVTIGRDRMIQILYRKDNQNWKLLQTLTIHKSNVTSLIIHEDRIITGSTDRTVAVHRITSENTVELVKILTMKFSPLSIGVFDNELIISLLDKSLQNYDLNKLELKKTHKFDLNVDNIVKSNGFFIASSANRSLQVINPSSGTCVFRTWGHSDSIKRLVLTDNDGLITLSQGCLFDWKILQEDEQDHEFSLTKPIARKVIRRESPVRSPSKLPSTPSNLSVSNRPNLPPSDRRTPSALSSTNGSPLANNSPSLRGRSPVLTSPLRSLSPTNRTNAPSTSLRAVSSHLTRSNSVKTLSNGIRSKAVTLQSSRSIIPVFTPSSKPSTLRPNGVKQTTSTTLSNKENTPATENGTDISKIDQILRLLETVKMNQDSYTVGDIKRLKEGIEFLWDDEEKLLEKYNNLLLNSMKSISSGLNSDNDDDGVSTVAEVD